MECSTDNIIAKVPALSYTDIRSIVLRVVAQGTSARRVDTCLVTSQLIDE